MSPFARLEYTRDDWINDSLIRLDFDAPDAFEWEFLGVTGDGDASKRKLARLKVPNPLKPVIGTPEILTDDVKFDNDTATRVPIVLKGSGFRPDLVLTAANGELERSTYLSPNRWYAVVTNPESQFFLTLQDSSGRPLAIQIVKRPKPKEADPAPPSKTTTIEIQKTVTEKP